MTTPPPPGPERGTRAIRVLAAVLIVLVVAGGLAAVVVLVPGHHKTAATQSPDATASRSNDTSTSSSLSDRPDTSAASAPTSTAADPSTALEEQVARAYRQFLRVNDQVFNSSTANVNVLSSVATGDELTHLIELVSQMRGRGYVSTGETRVVSTSVVLAPNNTSATVTACIDASGSSTIDTKTGRTVGQEASGHQIEVVYMTPAASTWKVSGGPPQPTAGTC